MNDQTSEQILAIIKAKLNEVEVEEATPEFIKEIQTLFEEMSQIVAVENTEREIQEAYESQRNQERAEKEVTPEPSVAGPPARPEYPTVTITCRSTKGSCGHNQALMNNIKPQGVSYYSCTKCNGSWQVSVGQPLNDLKNFNFNA